MRRRSGRPASCAAREGVQQRAAPVQADEVIGQAAPEIGDVARGQRMVRRRHHHQPVAAKRHQVQAAPGHAGGADAQVGQAVLHRSRDVAAQLFLDLHARAGAARHEVGQRRRQELHQRGHIGPQPHMTARALACSLSSLLKSSKPWNRRAACCSARRPAAVRPRPARCVRAAAAGGGLEIRQAPAGRRQGQVAVARALSDAAALRHGAEQTQGHEVHARGVDQVLGHAAV